MMRLAGTNSIGLLMGSALCLSLGSVAAKVLLGRMSPLSFLVVQLCASICFLWSVVLFQRRKVNLGASLKPITLVGIVIGTGAIFTVLALKFTTASQASLIFAVQPVLIMAFAWLLLGERSTTTYIFLGVLAVLGVAIIVGTGASFALDSTLLGNLFAFLSTTFAALYVVWMRKITSVQDPLISLAVLQTVAAIVAIFAWLVGSVVLQNTFDNVSIYEWVGAAGVGIVYYGLAFWLYLLGLQQIPASQAGLFLNLVPVFTVGSAFLFLGETLSNTQWLGAAVVLVAVLGISLLIVRDERTAVRNVRGVNTFDEKTTD